MLSVSRSPELSQPGSASLVQSNFRMLREVRGIDSQQVSGLTELLEAGYFTSSEEEQGTWEIQLYSLSTESPFRFLRGRSIKAEQGKMVWLTAAPSPLPAGA